ncbi:ceramidase [Xylariomycetidae sp. FL2044]|nr:ceramidase [Xylariomycetidae sp. FL2044]
MFHSNLLEALSFPYHEPPPTGFWGEKTSTLNFCEEDYVITYYVAELCNTLTNALFIWLGTKGLIDCKKNNHPQVFFVTFIGYMVTFFHASLKYVAQLVDELAMIYTTCFMCYATFAYGRTVPFRVTLGTGLVGLAGFITIRYYITKDPQFHQDGAYAILTAIVVFSNLWIMEKRVRPALRERQDSRNADVPGPCSDTILKEMWIMVATGLSVFLGGYLIWNLDNWYCDTIRVWRHRVGLPWALLLEGHGWWHLMTGVGAYFYIVWRIWIQRCLDGDEDRYRLVWPSLLSLPLVVGGGGDDMSQTTREEKKTM